ncbi:GNAT family N-acetyltransferase [Myroides sp. LJL119]
MEYTIRKATPNDVDVVPELMLQAMQDIVFTFIQSQDIEEAIHFLSTLFQQPDNLYSYQNTFVAVDKDGEIMGCITGYDGADFFTLRQPVLQYMSDKYQNDYQPEPETSDDQFYLDTVAVSVLAQGKGVGTRLLKHMIDYAKSNGHGKVGLIVDLENPDAMKLYSRLGFKQADIIDFAGAQYYNMYI